MKQDRFRKSQGGTSRLLDISCEKCGYHLFYYQKDGQGIIKRLYLDRIYPAVKPEKQLFCPKCKELLGQQFIYKKESRSAYRVFSAAITKEVLPVDKVK